MLNLGPLGIAAGVLAAALTSTPLLAQPAATTPHQHAEPPGHPHGEDPGATLCVICPGARESAGTSWQPDRSETHAHAWQAGRWQLATHAQLALVQTSERGSRGDDQFFSTSHAMVLARRPLGSGVFSVRTMWSLDPAMGRDGYPLLLQTGETGDGVTPLIDRQHPHDFPMELAATYARGLAGERGLYIYAALAGSPALGPPPFMHRESASRLPTSPITHHWLDATHITYGVLTVGFIASPKVKLEGSAFRGREPDQHRWGFETPSLDSFSFRLSVNPAPSLAIQVSAGHLNEPEQFHPGADVVRLTASGMYSRKWERLGLDATLAWGRNKRGTATLPAPGGVFFYPANVTQGALAEATLHVTTRHHLLSRFEHARKDELFGLADPRHSVVYPVSRFTAGYVVDVVSRPRLRVGAGVAASYNRIPNGLQPEYDGSPGAVLAFIDIAAH